MFPVLKFPLEFIVSSVALLGFLNYLVRLAIFFFVLNVFVVSHASIFLIIPTLNFLSENSTVPVILTL